MKEKFIILRVAKPSYSTIHFGPLAKARNLGFDSPPPSVKVEMEDIEPFKAEALKQRNKDVLAVGPSLPIRLVQPMQVSKAVASYEHVKNGWGITATGADKSPYTGEGIVIAVLDTGIDKKHEAFTDRNLKLIEKDFTDEGNGDSNGHGTHCAGVIFGRNTNDVRIGIAPGVKKALVGKVLGKNGGGTTDMIIQAMEWAVGAGANVISMSLGIDFPGYVAYLQQKGFPAELAATRALEGYRSNLILFSSLAESIKQKSNYGVSAPCLMIAAAGNESRSDENPNFKIAVSPPAVADGIVSVAALYPIKKEFGVAAFSNTGATLAAPGVEITSAKAGGGLINMSGTSMAAPHVAGIAALWGQKLLMNKKWNALNFGAHVIGSCKDNCFPNSIDPADIGLGLVQAPMDK